MQRGIFQLGPLAHFLPGTQEASGTYLFRHSIPHCGAPLHCSEQYCIALHCSEQYCIALHCTALQWTTMNSYGTCLSIKSNCTAEPNCISVLYISQQKSDIMQCRHYLLQTARCTLYSTDCILHNSHCTLYSPQCTL